MATGLRLRPPRYVLESVYLNANRVTVSFAHEPHQLYAETFQNAEDGYIQPVSSFLEPDMQTVTHSSDFDECCVL